MNKIISFFYFSEVLIIALVLIITLPQIVNMQLHDNHVFFNVLVLVIEDVVIIPIYLVDKMEWAYVFEDKVGLEVC